MIVSAVLLTVASISFAAVSGKPMEKLGTEWKQSSFKDWVTRENALITPEASNLALQYCLRTTQEKLDGTAYDKVAVPMVRDMQSALLRGSLNTSTEKGLAELTKLLVAIQAIKVKGEYPDPYEYIPACEKVVKANLDSARDLWALYEGRMNPKDAKNLPEDVRKRLELLRARGVRVSPLKADTLVQQICQLEGYYSTSNDSRLWKLFSTTRAMANVLRHEENNAEFEAVMKANAKIARNIGLLDRYSAVAGRPNGASAGMTEAEVALAKKATPVRLTGPALGSTSTALMAFFTTAWREKLQDHVIQPDYPRKPFQLISADQVLKASKLTAEEIPTRGADSWPVSQTEQGMAVVWGSILGWHSPEVRPIPVYGQNTLAYKNAAALAWIALNAETNIRQNEKVAGIERTSLPQNEFSTRYVFADVSSYQGILKEIEAAQVAYRVIDTTGKLVAKTCLDPVQKFAAAAAAASKDKDGQVLQLDARDTAVFAKGSFGESFEFKPVIADIGTELKGDPEGLRTSDASLKEFDGQTDFNLHLATGYWREVPVTVRDGHATRELIAGTPSAYVVHFKKTTSTADWQKVVYKYDLPSTDRE